MSENDNAQPQRKRLDLDAFQPSPVRADPETRSAATRIAQEAGFTTRHGKAEADATDSAPLEVSRRGRKRTTGRNTQFTVKLKAETNNAIYDLAERLNAGALAEVIEQAIDALQEKLQADGKR